MKNIHNELQDIIIGNGRVSPTGKLEKAQNFLRGNASSGFRAEKQKSIKIEEAFCLIDFASKEDLFYEEEISQEMFITSGAEQRVYRYDDYYVIKVNDGIFYESWLDYFNNLLIHNYFFRSTAYHFLGFKIINKVLFAVVKQEFIVSDEVVDLVIVKNFLAYNGFQNTRNNDYYNPELGIILEDLHDENVLCRKGVLYFIDTVFYLTGIFINE